MRRLHASAAPLVLAFAMAGAFDAYAQSVVLSGDTDPLAAGDIDAGVDLLVGASGVGAVIVSGSAQIISAAGTIGQDAAGDGEVLVTGQDSSWEVLGRLNVGNSGLGGLRIESQAEVRSAEALVGADSGGGGDVVVTGGASWINAGQLTVGSYGQGDLLVEAGGKVSSNQGYIGAGAGADGHVTVTGPGSTWVTTAYNINVGNFGTGTLTIENGGLVRAVAGVDLGYSAPTASGTLVLGNGGANLAVLETSRFLAGQGVASVTIDGGVLRALQDRSSFLTNFGARNVTLGANGAVIDTNGYNIGIAPGFVGTGTLTKTGTGVLTLTGANTYAGATQVNAGRLDINGDQTGAAGLTTVNLGGTLGGTGIVGDDVESVSGKISPGAASAPGTLTINGDLVLDAASGLDYRLGQAGAVGGLLNDLLVVRGDLTLDGVLNVTQSAGGTFGPGVYRLIDYDGALHDQGLSLGALPGGGTKSIQTAIAKLVNLVFTAPPGGGGGGGDPPPPPSPPAQLNFWDGDAGRAGDGTITGGDGVWHGATGSVWTKSDGATNGRFVNGVFAIFTASPGTVMVDNGPGAISVNGLQFASDGYQIAGGAIGLDAGEAIVRVGDGTSGGAAFKATIASELTGPGQLHKSDLGTLILTGANSYSGATRISSGVLQLGDGGTTGSILGDVTVDAVLAFNRSDATTFGGLSGAGQIRQMGSGVTTLSADSSHFTGRTEVQNGTLAVDGRLGGAVEVLGGARLTGTGQVGPVLNQTDGIVAPGRGIGVLTVAGDYESRGGTLQLEAVLGGDDSAADRLAIHGSTSGLTLVEVANLGGAGAQTVNGVPVIAVDGASNGVFTLARGDLRLGRENALVAGAYVYVLRQDVQGGDWKLRSSVSGETGALSPADPSRPAGDPGPPVDPALPQVTLYQPGVPIYEAYPQALQAMNGLTTMRQRIGARQWSGAERAGVWGRVEGRHLKAEPEVSTSQTKLKTDYWKVQFGIDHVLVGGLAGGRLVGALTAHYAEAESAVASPHGGGRVEGDAYGVGGTLTWMGQSGAYIDAQAQASWFKTDLRSSVLGDRVKDADANGYAFSVETGQPIAAGGVFNLIPQAQLTYAKVEFDTFVDPLGARVSADQGDSLLGRLGLSLDRDWTGADAGGQGSIYGVVNMTHEFLDGSRADVSGASISSRAERTWGGVAAGASYAWDAGRYQVHGEGSIETSLSHFGDSYAAYGSAGFRMRF